MSEAISNSRPNFRAIRCVVFSLVAAVFVFGIAVKPSCVSAAEVAQKPVVTKVIVLGGAFSGQNNAIFSWVDRISPGAIRIPGKVFSVARNVKRARAEINNQLSQGNRVLLIGHSLGSIIACRVQREYQGKDVSSIYVDPPYHFSLFELGVLVLFPGFQKMRNDAACGGISVDPNTVDWTGGYVLHHFLIHNAFSYPTYGINAQRLTNLELVIRNRISDDSWRSISPAQTLTPAVNKRVSS